MATQSPAEKLHNRILNGNAWSTKDVTADAFETVARNAGTLQLPNVKQMLDRLRAQERAMDKAGVPR